MYMTCFRNALLCATLVASAQYCHKAVAATHYDAVRNFRLKANPNGVWIYSDSAPLQHRHRSYEGVPGLENWSNDDKPGTDVSIIVNTTGSTVSLDNGTTSIPTGYLALNAEDRPPGANVQFQAPTPGAYTFRYDVTGLNTDEANNTYLFVGLNGDYTQSIHVRSKTHKHFVQTITIAAGDVMSFINRSNGKKGQDYIGLAVKVTGP